MQGPRIACLGLGYPWSPEGGESSRRTKRRNIQSGKAIEKLLQGGVTGYGFRSL